MPKPLKSNTKAKSNDLFGSEPKARAPLKVASRGTSAEAGYTARDIEVLEGSGALRAQFIEDGGATYLGELQYDIKKRGRQTVVAFFDKANWVGYSRPDADGKLTPSSINGVLIGINAQRNSRVRLAISNVRWVRY